MFLGRSDGCTACGAAKLAIVVGIGARRRAEAERACLLYTSDAADERS